MTKDKTAPAQKGASLYHDAPFRSEFLMLAAMGSLEGEKGWKFLMEETLPRVIDEAKKHSRTPHLDCAFIEGVMSGLNARRVLHDVGKKP